MTRRAFQLSPFALGVAQPTEPAYWAITPERIKAHDDRVDRLLDEQVKDEKSRWFGGIADADGLYSGGTTAGILPIYAACLTHPKSRFYDSALTMQRLRAATEFLKRHSSPEGNLHLQISNFNSPPDTAFAMYNICGAAHLARQAKNSELESVLEPVVKRHAAGVARGGVHTPNHRWVMCAALAQAHALYPNPEYLRRIDQWLAEGVDIDADGQYTERSTVVYNGVTNRALTTVAIKLNRPELLNPVRRNLDAMQFLLHPGMEVVTDISTRQDQYAPGTLAGYWLAARHLAVKDRNGLYEAYARQGSPGLAELMEYPDLQQAGPEPSPLPENYERILPSLGIARIRRGLTSATIRFAGTSRFLSLRRGSAVIQAVRVASAFFGKGQFIPTKGGRTANGYTFEQHIEAPYYQPLGVPVAPGHPAWSKARLERKQSEICRFAYSATVSEFEEGFRLDLKAGETAEVPLAVEISFRPGGQLEGVEEVKGRPNSYILKSGTGTYKLGRDVIRFGPGRAEHRYTAVRGAEPQLPGPSVYLTSFTPVEQTLEFRLG